MFFEESPREHSQNNVTDVQEEEAIVTHFTVSTLCRRGGGMDGEEGQREGWMERDGEGRERERAVKTSVPGQELF